MKEYIESWKALIFALELFCVGGFLFADKKKKIKDVLYLAFLLCVVVIIVTS